MTPQPAPDVMMTVPGEKPRKWDGRCCRGHKNHEWADWEYLTPDGKLQRRRCMECDLVMTIDDREHA